MSKARTVQNAVFRSLRSYALAVLSSVAAVALRAALDPALGDAYPFIFSFGAVAVSAAYGGWRPAVLASALSYLADAWMFIPPRYTIKLEPATDAVAMASFAFTCGIITVLAEGMRRARKEQDQQSIELRKANEELESGRERLRVTLASIGDAVIATDAKGLIQFLNPVAEQLTGWTKQEAAGRPLSDVFVAVNETTRERAENPLEKVTQRGAAGELANHTLLIRRNGTEAPIENNGAPIWSRNGEMEGAVLVFRDVSARRAAQAKLQAQTAQAQLLSDTLKELLTAANPDTIVRDLCPRVAAQVGADCYFNFMVNDRADALRLHSYLGISGEVARSIERLEFGQAICGTVAQKRQPFVADDIQRSTYDIAALARSFGIQTYACHPLIAGDRLLGTLSFASRVRTAFAEDELEFLKTISQYVALALDRLQTERALREQRQALQESEARFRELAENIPQLAWMTDEAGGVQWYNQRWYDYTGTTLAEMQGWGWQRVHHPDHSERVTKTWRKALAAVEQWEDTFPLRRRDGEYRWFLSRAFPIRDAKGNVFRWFGTNTDITELRETQEALRRTQKELEREKEHLETTVRQRTAKLQEAIGELEAFSYSVAHDMRAPLRSMRGFAGLLEEQQDKLDGEGRDYLRRIMTSAERLDRLIQDVLGYSQAARAELKTERIDPARLAREIVQSYPHLQAPDVEIWIEEPMPAVRANPAALTQVISNLLGNAKKFVAPGVKPQIRVRAQTFDGTVRLWVEDNGIGIAPADQERIFTMFQRAHGKDTYDGTGMGLAIVRKAAERMSGRVGVESEPGKGSRFWVELPAAN